MKKEIITKVTGYKDIIDFHKGRFILRKHRVNYGALEELSDYYLKDFYLMLISFTDKASNVVGRPSTPITEDQFRAIARRFSVVWIMEKLEELVEKGFLEKYEYNGQQGYKMTYKGIYPDDTRALFTHEVKHIYGVN